MCRNNLMNHEVYDWELTVFSGVTKVWRDSTEGKIIHSQYNTDREPGNLGGQYPRKERRGIYSQITVVRSKYYDLIKAALISIRSRIPGYVRIFRLGLMERGVSGLQVYNGRRYVYV